MSLLIKYVQRVRLLVVTMSLTFDHVCIKKVISQARNLLGFPCPRHPFRSWIKTILRTANPAATWPRSFAGVLWASRITGAQDLIYFNEGGGGVAILEKEFQFPRSWS